VVPPQFTASVPVRKRPQMPANGGEPARLRGATPLFPALRSVFAGSEVAISAQATLLTPGSCYCSPSPLYGTEGSRVWRGGVLALTGAPVPPEAESHQLRIRKPVRACHGLGVARGSRSSANRWWALVHSLHGTPQEASHHTGVAVQPRPPGDGRRARWWASSIRLADEPTVSSGAGVWLSKAGMPQQRRSAQMVSEPIPQPNWLV
jgi:hypothetical protein